MQTVLVNIPAELEKKYKILIGENLLSQISDLINLKKYSKIAILTDKNVAPHWLEKLKNGLASCHPEQSEGSFITEIIIEPGEENKTLKTVESIWKKLKESQFDRKSLIINLGGGVVCDMGGFAASCYMRGIDFLQIPTTLLSQVDASVGGKTAVDLDGLKNLIGAFAQPIGVVIDTETLKTLPEREFKSGFGEVVKHGLIQDKNYFEQLLNSANPTEEISKIINTSCQIKQNVVSQDEKEGGLRKILNFGHTIGHAIETLSFETNQPLLHGEAISIGCIAEAKISQLLGHITQDEVSQIEKCFEKYDLPTKIDPSIKIEDILEKIIYDKKNIGGKTKWTLLKKVGEAIFDIEVDNTIVTEAVEYIK